MAYSVSSNVTVLGSSLLGFTYTLQPPILMLLLGMVLAWMEIGSSPIVTRASANSLADAATGKLGRNARFLGGGRGLSSLSLILRPWIVTPECRTSSKNSLSLKTIMYLLDDFTRVSFCRPTKAFSGVVFKDFAISVARSAGWMLFSNHRMADRRLLS